MRVASTSITQRERIKRKGDARFIGSSIDDGPRRVSVPPATVTMASSSVGCHMSLRMTPVNITWMALSSFGLYMLIDRLWVHSPLPYAVMFGLIVAIVCVEAVPRLSARLPRRGSA
jgi:hypothetical protein